MNKFFAFVLVLFISNITFATDGIVCTGTVDEIGLHATDTVTLKLSSMNTRVGVCSLSHAWGASRPVGAEQCKAVYSMLLLLQASGKPTTAYFDNVVTGTACNNFAPWELASIRFLNINK